MTLLALCHDIIVEEKGTELIYNAASPDELALVNFAKFMGYEYTGIHGDGDMVVSINGTKKSYHLEHILEFTSSRFASLSFSFSLLQKANVCDRQEF